MMYFPATASKDCGPSEVVQYIELDCFTLDNLPPVELQALVGAHPYRAVKAVSAVRPHTMDIEPAVSLPAEQLHILSRKALVDVCD